MIRKDNAKDWLPLVQALAEGKQLQCCYLPKAEDVDHLDTRMYSPAEYRIKPEPRRFWILEYPDGILALYKRREAAERGIVEGSRIIEVVEVLKDEQPMTTQGLHPALAYRKFRPRYQRAKKPGLVSLEQCWKRMQEEEKKRVEQWKKEHGYGT